MPDENHAIENVDRDERPKHEDRDDRTGGTTTTPQRSKPKRKQLPPWNVLLHNDDENDMAYVIDTLMMLTPLREAAATTVTLTAHVRGLSLVLATHKERAELYQQQFTSRGLTVTIEPQ